MSGASQLGESVIVLIGAKFEIESCKNATRQQLAQIDFSDGAQVHLLSVKLFLTPANFKL